MSPPSRAFQGRYIVVADEDKAVVGLVIETLLRDGHAVFQAYDGLSALQLALNLKICDLVITNTKVNGAPGVDLILELREQLPALAILYLANGAHSTPQLETKLPENVPILREPFGAVELREAVRLLLPPRLSLVGDGPGRRRPNRS